MFGSIGGPEILFVFVLALLLFGPRKLPEVGRTIGRTLAEFRKATNEFSASLEREVEVENLKELKSELKAPLLGQPSGTILREGERGTLAPAESAEADSAAQRPSLHDAGS